jgi:hypothetical protein
MSKIQILNETQVSHFIDVLIPELNRKFDKKVKELQEQAKKEKDNYLEHERIVKLKEEQNTLLNKYNKILDLSKQPIDIDPDYVIYRSHYSSKRIDQEVVDNLIKEHATNLEQTLIDLAETALFVNDVYDRKEQMHKELHARLSMVTVGTFDEIKKSVLESIKIDSYFTYPIN